MAHNKYRVAPKEERTFKGVAYHSKAEMLRAMEHDMSLKGSVIVELERQPRFILGDITYVADFRLIDSDGYEWVEDIKGAETPRFKLVRRIWAKYQHRTLVILKRDYRKRCWRREEIKGGQE